MDSKGIVVSLIYTSRGGLHTEHLLPLYGGRFKSGELVVEVRPLVELESDRSRSYEEVELVADEVDRHGGFAWHGDEIHIGAEIFTGRDVVGLLSALMRRANDRAGRTRRAVYRRGYERGFKAAQRQLKRATARMSP
jgi:hypothetical protein